MAKLPTEKELDEWIKHDLNVLFIGEAGVGKTSMIIDAFNRNNLKYRYYSASTMDPWVDLVGVPKEKVDDDGNTFLDLVRPREWASDEVEIVIVDEFNRAPKKIKNALMELIQFKSINGKKFNNLRMVWAAINPEKSANPNTSYDVEALDPAQKDRFHVHVEVPYECSRKFFSEKFGDIGTYLVDWWEKLSLENKFKLSPRRLSYIGDAIMKKIDISNFIPEGISSSEIKKYLNTKEFISILEKNKNDDVFKMDFCKNPNNMKHFIQYSINDPQYIPYYFTLLPKEYLISVILDTSMPYKKWLVSNKSIDSTSFRDIVLEIFSEDEIKLLFQVDLKNKVVEVSQSIDNLLKVNWDIYSQKDHAFAHGLCGDPTWCLHDRYDELCKKVEKALAKTNSRPLEACKGVLKFAIQYRKYKLENNNSNFLFGSISNRCGIGAGANGVYFRGSLLTDEQIESLTNDVKEKSKKDRNANF